MKLTKLFAHEARSCRRATRMIALSGAACAVLLRPVMQGDETASSQTHYLREGNMLIKVIGGRMERPNQRSLARRATYER
jgi:hypothetical protein